MRKGMSCQFFLLLLYTSIQRMPSIECNYMKKAYYQPNRDVLLNRAKDSYKNEEERADEQARVKYRNVSEKDKKMERENMEKIDIILCLKKKNKI